MANDLATLRGKLDVQLDDIAHETWDQTEKEDLAWAAGFFDGEGCISIQRSGSLPHHLYLSVSQVDPRPLARLMSAFGGTVRRVKPRNNQRPYSTWQITGRKAADALANIYEFLRSKREQAAVALAFQGSMDRNGARAGKKLTEQEWADRAVFASQVKALKRVDFYAQ